MTLTLKVTQYSEQSQTVHGTDADGKSTTSTKVTFNATLQGEGGNLSVRGGDIAAAAGYHVGSTHTVTITD